MLDQLSKSRHREFDKMGLTQVKRPELSGGGLVRSAGGWAAVIVNKVPILQERSELANPYRYRFQEGWLCRQCKTPSCYSVGWYPRHPNILVVFLKIKPRPDIEVNYKNCAAEPIPMLNMSDYYFSLFNRHTDQNIY